MGEGSKIGTFVEVKNTTVGARTKIPHLSYIGDADIGAGSNIAAGNITANYHAGKKIKSRTKIGNSVKTGVDTSFVAPVDVGDGAYTAAGSVITEDVPPGALAVARPAQKNVEGYAERLENEAGDGKP
jgi:bifunctional UDP-N-acetylglucosamine pyrophosphorylase/glucosamine-1-phosphate N-acetyltransferase